MDAERPAQRGRTNCVGASPERTKEGADEGRVDRNVGHHDRRPVGRLIPREKGAGDRHGQHQAEQAHPYQAPDGGSLVEPVVGGGDPTHHTDSVKRFWIKSVVPSILCTYWGSGLGGGPPTLFPVMS